MTRTYAISLDSARVHRLDNLTGPWTDVSLPPTFVGPIFQDVKTGPTTPDTVMVVGSTSPAFGWQGLYISNDAGANWVSPLGSYQGVAKMWYQLSWPDQNNVFACGERGYISASTDGGVTFNLTTGFPTPTGFAQSGNAKCLHFISPTTGVVGFNGSIFKTTDAGATWSYLNGGIPLTTPKSVTDLLGIHIDITEQVITALGREAIYRSTDGGATFTLVFDFTANQGRHLTWISDTQLWAIGDRDMRMVSVDSGATWSVLSVYNPITGPFQWGAYFYSATDGFYGSNSSVMFTTDAGASGTVSDTMPTQVKTIWTMIEPDCGCPPGYSPSPDGSDCILVESVGATSSGTIYTVAAGNQLTVYSNLGANFYEDSTGRPLPISEYAAPNRLADALTTTLTVDQNIINSLWGDGTSAPYKGRLNNAGVWTNMGGTPVGEWIGFTACVEVAVAGVYCIGLGADNRARFSINGVLIVELDNGTTWSFNVWHVIPVTLQAGTNIIQLEGKNDGASAAFAAEIYSATTTQLANMTTLPQLQAVTIFSTVDKIGQDFDLGEDSGYTCPIGYVLSNCNGSYSCLKITHTPIVPCCYLITRCDDQTIQLVVGQDISAYIGRIVQVQNGTCWNVVGETPCINPVSIIILSSFDTCQECLAPPNPCFLLIDCDQTASPIETLEVSTDLTAYVGQIVQIVGSDKCWLVTESQDCTCPESVVIAYATTTCELCPAPVPVRPKARNIAPGKPPACDLDLLVEVNVTYAEAWYKEVLSRRFGINVCCGYDLDMSYVKREVVLLQMLYDPLVCCPQLASPGFSC